MKNLVEVINGLTENEVQAIEVMFMRNMNCQNSKKKKLFHLVRHENYSLNAALRKVDNVQRPSKSLAQLSERLIDDIYDELVSKGEKPDRLILKNETECHRLIGIARMLFGKEKYCEAGQYLCRAMSSAKEGELFTEQLIIYHNYRSNYIFYGERYSILNIDVTVIGNINTLLSECEMLLYEIKAILYNGILPSQNTLSKWKQNLNKIEGTLLSQNSHRLSFYLGWIRILLARHDAHNNQALVEVKKISKILRNSSVFHSEKLLISVYGLNAVLLLKTGNIIKGRKNFDKISESSIELYLSPDPCALENTFQAALFLGNYSKAEMALKVALNSVIIKRFPYVKFKWSLFSAVLAFQQTQFHKAKTVIDTITFCNKKKTPFEFYTYVLLVMCAVESDELNEILVNSGTWHQLFLRNAKTFAVKEPRLSAILKVLKTLLLSGFDFQKTLTKENVLMGKLSEGKDHYKFEPFGFELVRFDNWMMRHKNKRKITG